MDVVAEHPTAVGVPGGDTVSRQQQLDTLARDWASIVIETSRVPMTRAEIEQYLLQLVRRLVHELTHEPLAVDRAAEVGVDLVAARFTGPAMLSRTLQLLGNSLLRLSEFSQHGRDRVGAPPGNEHASRVVSLLATLADGYARAQRELVLQQQESIKRAAVNAVLSATDAALEASEMRFHTLFSASALGILIADLKGFVVDANPALRELLGYEANDIRTLNMYDLLHPEDAAGVLAYWVDVAEGACDHFRARSRMVRADGEPVWTHLAAWLVRNAGGKPAYLLAMVENVSDAHLLQQRFQHQMLHDPLTGLPNRELFLSRLDSALARRGPRERVALCYLDIDGFNVINDGLGYQIGDKLLKAFATRLRSAVAGEDSPAAVVMEDSPAAVVVEEPAAVGEDPPVIVGYGSPAAASRTAPDAALVARIGGDEFAILIDGSAGAPSTIAMIEEVLAQLSEPFHIEGHVLSVSASVGIVDRSPRGIGYSELMRQADITLHWAKSDGKGQWALFDSERNVRDRTKFELAAAMPFALEIGEFQLDYQPMVRLRDGAVIGAEALVRWQHPELGVLPLEQFVGLAEQTGFIMPLAKWALREACEQASQWHRQLGDAAPFVSISVPPGQLYDPDLIRDVQAVLHETGLPPGRLQFGVRTILSRRSDGQEALEVLAEVGVRVVIDGFGTFADVGMLRHLPINGVKIARSLVAGLTDGEETDPVGGQVLANLVSTAHLLGLTTNTDGVKTAAQAARLADMGSDVGQGDFFAPPGRPEDIEAMISGAATR